MQSLLILPTKALQKAVDYNFWHYYLINKAKPLVSHLEWTITIRMDDILNSKNVQNGLCFA
jgi:hypothetical protein